MAWRVWSALRVFALLVVAIPFAFALCLLYIVGDFVLWVVGLWMICTGLQKNWHKKNDDVIRGPKAMPGQEEGDHWKTAWELAKLQNQRSYEVYEDRARVHFNVVSFAQRKTGLSMENLVRLAKARHESKSGGLEK